MSPWPYSTIPGCLKSPPEWLLTAASWAFTPEDELPEPRYPLNNLPFAGQLFKPDAVVTIENPSKDPRLDAQARELFVEMLKARSLLFAPLVVGGQWIGQIIAIYQSPTRFEETNLRQLSSLVGQAAVVVQNNRLLQETRRRADQLQTAAVIARDLWHSGSGHFAGAGGQPDLRGFQLLPRLALLAGWPGQCCGSRLHRRGRRRDETQRSQPGSWFPFGDRLCHQDWLTPGDQ